MPVSLHPQQARTTQRAAAHYAVPCSQPPAIPPPPARIPRPAEATSPLLPVRPTASQPLARAPRRAAAPSTPRPLPPVSRLPRASAPRPAATARPQSIASPDALPSPPPPARAAQPTVAVPHRSARPIALPSFLTPSAADTASSNEEIGHDRPRDTAAIPEARPTQPIPALNLSCQNMRGSGTRSDLAQLTADNATQRQLDTDPSTPAQPAHDSRFYGSNERSTKLATLITHLRRSDMINSPDAVDIAFLQETTTADSLAVLLESRLREYQAFSATPGGANDSHRTVITEESTGRECAAALKHDTAILVHERLGNAELQASVSCPRATFVTIPAR
ncbi:hypothetical protein GGI21_005963, partial [Coemansia aciculifera]